MAWAGRQVVVCSVIATKLLIREHNAYFCDKMWVRVESHVLHC